MHRVQRKETGARETLGLRGASQSGREEGPAGSPSRGRRAAQVSGGSWNRRRQGVGLRVHGVMQELEEVRGTEHVGKAPPHPLTGWATGWLSQGCERGQACGWALASLGPRCRWA